MSISTITLAVPETAAGDRLDRFLAAHAHGYSRVRLKALIETGAVRRAGAVVGDPATKVKAGDVYELTTPAPVAALPQAEDVPLHVLFEDDDLLVLDKPAGLTVHPGAGAVDGTLVNALLHHCGDSLSGIGGVIRPGIVHRLDKDTSGVMVVAKNDAAHRGLSAMFSAHDLERRYLAICHGAPRPGVGTIERPLARAANDRRKMAVVAEDHPAGRHAVTHFRRIAGYGVARARLPGDSLASLIELTLETGRTHQIRVHLASLGHPVLGDPVYGRHGLSGLRDDGPAAAAAMAALAGFRRQALHAAVLAFTHPVTGEDLAFETPPPADFTALAAALAAL